MDLIGPYLARQRWYGGDGVPASLRTVDSGRLVAPPVGGGPGGPGAPSDGQLHWAIVEAEGSDYQLVIADRPDAEGLERAKGHEEALIGTVDGRTYYDATVDPEMALALLQAASGGQEQAQRARRLTAEQSNTSIVYDDRLILKFFRRLALGPNPDAEVTSALAATGFSHVAQPRVRWQRQGRDLAFGQQYLAGGTDGWALALTSLRDFYAAADSGPPTNPGLSGGDFAAEVARLGQVTAEMHLAMADAFPVSPDYSAEWEELLRSLEARVGQLAPDMAGPAAPLMARLRAVADPGPAVRAHGDYHLGQVMRTDAGWYVLDFEGEPNRPLEERLRPTSVMKDVAGMLRSLQYASRFAIGERAEAAADLEAMALAWEGRNRGAFAQGYFSRLGIGRLVPPDPDDREAVRLAFELDKVLYELGYEDAFRPGWAAIPRAGLERLLSQPLEVLMAGSPGAGLVNGTEAPPAGG